jgi:hypothetical protein
MSPGKAQGERIHEWCCDTEHRNQERVTLPLLKCSGIGMPCFDWVDMHPHVGVWETVHELGSVLLSLNECTNGA